MRGPERQEVKQGLKDVPRETDPRIAPSIDKPRKMPFSPGGRKLRVTLAKLKSALSMPSVTAMNRSKFQAWKDKLEKQLDDESPQEMSTYERIYNLLIETRSAKNIFKTKARKERGVEKKRKKGALQGAGKSMDAWRQGQAAGKSLGQAKASRSAAASVEKHSIKYPGDNPKERSRVTAAAVNALRTRALRKERKASAQTKAGKRSAHNKRAVNRTLKRDETMRNLGKLTIRGSK